MRFPLHIYSLDNHAFIIIRSIAGNAAIMIRTIKNRIRLFACFRKLSYRYLSSIRIIQWIRRSRRRTIIITNPLLQPHIVVYVVSTDVVGMSWVLRSLNRAILASIFPPLGGTVLVLLSMRTLFGNE